jgi:hypothetical protein
MKANTQRDQAASAANVGELAFIEVELERLDLHEAAARTRLLERVQEAARAVDREHAPRGPTMSARSTEA